MSNSQEQKCNRKPSSLTGTRSRFDPVGVKTERGTVQNNGKSPSEESVSPSILHVSPSIEAFMPGEVVSNALVRARIEDDPINNEDMSNETTGISNEIKRNERNKSDSGPNQSPLTPTQESRTPAGWNQSHQHQKENNVVDGSKTFETAPETVANNDTEVLLRVTSVPQTTDAGTNPQKLNRSQKRRQQRKKCMKKQEENNVYMTSNRSADSSQNQQNSAVSGTTETLAQPRRQSRHRNQGLDSTETNDEMAVESALDRQENNDVTQIQEETSRMQDPKRSVSVTKLSKNQRRKRNKQKRQQDTEDGGVTNQVSNNNHVPSEDNRVLSTSAANVTENSVKDALNGNAVLLQNNENGLPSASQTCVPQATPTTSISTSEVVGQDKGLGKRDVVPYDRAFADRQTLIHWSVCLFCKSEGFNKLRCRRCEMARYCNKDCRRQDKANHRPHCKLVTKFFKAKAKIPSSFLERLREKANFMGVSFFIGSLPDVTRFKVLGGSKIGVLVEIIGIIPDDDIWKVRVRDVSNHAIEVVFDPTVSVQTLGKYGVFVEDLELAKHLKRGRFLLLLNSHLSCYETKSALIEIQFSPLQVMFINIDT